MRYDGSRNEGKKPLRPCEMANRFMLTIDTLADEGMSCILVTHEMGFAVDVVDHYNVTDWAGTNQHD